MGKRPDKNETWIAISRRCQFKNETFRIQKKKFSKKSRRGRILEKKLAIIIFTNKSQRNFFIWEILKIKKVKLFHKQNWFFYALNSEKSKILYPSKIWKLNQQVLQKCKNYWWSWNPTTDNYAWRQFWNNFRDKYSTINKKNTIVDRSIEMAVHHQSINLTTLKTNLESLLILNSKIKERLVFLQVIVLNFVPSASYWLQSSEFMLYYPRVYNPNDTKSQTI